MAKIKINLKDQKNRSYNILIKKDITDDLLEYLKKNELGSRYAVISDSKVAKLFGEKMVRTLVKNKIGAELINFTPGEKSKSIEQLINIAEIMLKKGFTRKDAIIALGGGVTGDLAGFMASSYMRGIPYIQIPTTLLAMVDSSVGGKTGIDLPFGKNLLGAFHQPKAVFIGTDYLKNLPEKQIKNGLAEIIKYGVIKDENLFVYIEKNLEKILTKDEKTLTKIIKDSIKIKEKIVEIDEKDKEKRIILNYGHTFGHAIEKKSNYKLLHGYAISIGMVLANKIAVKKGILEEKYANRIKNLLRNSGLPVVTMKTPTKKDISTDKKRIGNYVQLIVPINIGEVTSIKIPCT